MKPKQKKQKKILVAPSQSLPLRIGAALQKRRPQIRFLAIVVVSMGCYYALTGIDSFSKQFLPAYLSVVAAVTSSALSLLGFVTTTSGTTLSSQAFAMNIAYGCDALEPTFLFVVVVLAFPAPWKKKLWGVLGGVALLYAINIIRLITLFLTGTHKREYFELMHIEVWQALFIILALALFVIWATITERTPKHEAI